MAPISTTITETEQIQSERTLAVTVPGKTTQHLPQKQAFHTRIGNGMPIKWFNVVMIFAYHIWFVHSIFVLKLTLPLFFWTLFTGFLAGFGVTGGVHRYWTHRTYKANLPLRIFLMICFSIAGQNTIFDWVRDHRVHHKYSDTDADPHNARKGFFFSHCGWLMQQKHPEVVRKGKQIDMSDVLADPVVQFSQRHFGKMKLLCCFIIPTLVPVVWWGEDWYNSFLSQGVIRYINSLNCTWSVNSAAHIWGYKPYDTRIKPSENIVVSLIAIGEGWHNYHHVFPWDYKAAELGTKLNLTTYVLDMFAKIGWAWDMKQPSKELVRRVMLKNGDHQYHHHHHPEEVAEEEDLPYRCQNSAATTTTTTAAVGAKAS